MRVVHTIRDTPHNPNGICALAADSDRCYLAYPGRANVGEVININDKQRAIKKSQLIFI